MGLGLADEDSARLSGVAATASVLALVGNTALKYVVGRARPELNLGDASFNNLNKQATNSSFASSHTAVAFALITPFAQAYDMPWLYGLGALTAVGRVEQRQHWLSDTVAGGAMGYAISSAMMNARGGARFVGSQTGVPQVFVTPRQIQLAWAIP
jgi:membrane-associated phospholipid phosphatase